MALDFPSSSASPYEAPNGVTYVWDTNRWVSECSKGTDCKDFCSFPTSFEWTGSTTTLKQGSAGTGYLLEYDNAIEFSINGGALNQLDKTVSNGDVVYTTLDQVKVNNASNGQSIGGRLYSTDGNYDERCAIIINKHPDSMSFPNVTGASTNTKVESSSIPATGSFNVPLKLYSPYPGSLAMTEIEYSVNDGSWAAEHYVSNGDIIRVRAKTGGSSGTYQVVSRIGDVLGGPTIPWEVVVS